MRVIVIGTSAGGIEALKTLLGKLPADLAAFRLSVIHIPSQSPGVLAGLLGKPGQLRCVHPCQGESLPCTVLFGSVAQTDCFPRVNQHVLVGRRQIKATSFFAPQLLRLVRKLLGLSSPATSMMGLRDFSQ